MTKIKNLKFNEFQIKNLSMAIASAKLCNLKEKKIFNSLDKIKNVSGRLELIRIFPNNVKTFVDFAHTPDALKKWFYDDLVGFITFSMKSNFLYADRRGILFSIDPAWSNSARTSKIKA